jgi:hypothetical protein
MIAKIIIGTPKVVTRHSSPLNARVGPSVRFHRGIIQTII